MAQDHDINPVLKQVLELGPTLAFFAIYLNIRDDMFEFRGEQYTGFVVSTVVFIPILMAAMAVLWGMTRELSKIQIFTAVMVVFFGGLTAWFNDERFFKMKTTLVYAVFSAILGVGLLRGRSYLALVLSEAIPLAPAGWMQLTKRLTWFFAVLAIGNEIVWRTMSTDAWVKIETFGFTIVIVAFLWWNIMDLQKPDRKATARRK